MNRLFFFAALLAIATANCNTFRKTFLTAKASDGRLFHDTVTGCLNKNAFDNAEIVELSIRSQNVPILRPNAIINFQSLRLINFNGSKIERLEPGAFRFLPQLSDLRLSFNRIRTIPDNVFNGLNIKRLHVNDNGLTEIESNAFRGTKKLLEFYGSKNNLKYFNREWFKDSIELRVIDLSNNKLRNLPARAFATNAKLRNLYLNSNGLSMIQDDAFYGLKSLDYLSLAGNNLKQLYSKTFPNSFAIRELNLNNNRLNFIPNALLKHIRVNDINVSSNPWKCACLDNVKKLISSRNGRVKSYCSRNPMPACGHPNGNTNSCTELYDESFTKSFYAKYVSGKVAPSEC